ncbi:MAG: hypothetical protein IT454_14625 [Planctomycetes bacterium]|nr:hypothetical protein [Planctomycetota bacterium]
MRSRLACALVLLASTSLAQSGFDPDALDDELAHKHWGYLSSEEQADCWARFEGEVPYLGTYQLELIRYARALEERDLGYLPLDEPAPYFDPAEHAPAQPIARQRLEFDAPQAQRERQRIYKSVPARGLISAWRYDWGRREVLRTGELEDVQRGFANALAGFAPGHDLALALVERALDDGSQQRTLAAFGHAYTDRVGTVFPGITLYDAWASGQDLEMPDVDVLGVVHDVLGIRDKWSAPVPTSKQRELYEQVGELFHPAQRHRGLRQALAWTYLEGAPPLSAPYPVCIDRFHALWESTKATPSEAAKLLPKFEQWSEFLAEWDTRFNSDESLHAAALVRRRQLKADARAVRSFFLRIMSDAGAFERRALPAPKPPKKPATGAK